MVHAKETTRFRFWLWLIRLIGVIVPQRLRADWKQEWAAELQHRELLLASWDHLNWRSKFDLLRRSTSAFWDALWLQPQRLEDEMFQDLRYGIRMLRKHPGFTLVAIATLALGIGANTTIFTMVNSILLRPLAFKEPERLVMIWRANAERTSTDLPSSVPVFIDWQQRNQQMTAFINVRFNLASEGEAKLVGGTNVTASFFETLGVPPLLGRGFIPGEDKPGTEAVVVLGHDLWQQEFGAAQNIIGKRVTINAEPCTVVGVMPHGFDYPGEARLWKTLTLDPNANRQAYFLNVLARLKPGVTNEQAHSAMDHTAAELASQNAQSSRDYFDLRPLSQQLTGDLRRPLLLLFGAVAFVLLIACANIANLLLARASGREREIAVRAALGARKTRLLRQLLTESLLLSVLGGIAGFLLAVWSLSWLGKLRPLQLARLNEVALDGRVLGFTLLAIVLTGIIFGLIPALQVSLQQPSAVLKASGSSADLRPQRQRLRAGLMVVEIAMSLVLLVGAGLLIRSFLRLRAVDPGFKPEGLVTLNLSLPAARYAQPESRTAFIQQITEKLQALPGVESTATAAYSPLSDIYNQRIFIIEGRPETPQGLFAGQVPVSPDYFQTLRIPLLSGRAFSVNDSANAPGVVVVNQTFARRFFPNESVVGKRIHLGTRRPPVWSEIVGVVGDVRQLKLDREAPPIAYVPHLQSAWSVMSLLVRPKGEPQMITAALKQAVATIDKDLGVAGLTTLDVTVADAMAQRRLLMTLLGVFAGLALLLASIGIYGVIAYSVARRTQEIGIRMALGAEGRDVLRLVIGQGLKLTLLGVAFGLLASFALTQLMEKLLFEVRPTDPWTFVVLPMLLIVVALLASYFPARRATRIDPMVALRHE